MGQSTFPVPSSGSSTSTILPVNASSVILDGSLTSAGTYTTTVNGNGGIAYLTATDNPATITVGGTAYSVPANTVVASKAFGSSTSVTVASSGFSGSPPNFTSSTMTGSSLGWYSVAYGNGYYVAVAFGTSAGSYSTNGTTWTASTMPANTNWTSVAYGSISGVGYFVAVSAASNYGAYSTNGSTWTSSSTSGSAPSFQSVTYGNGRFVAVAAGDSTVANSTNGTTWTSGSVTAYNWLGVGYGLIGATGYYVAVSNSGFSAYSTNGTSWTTFSASVNTRSIANGNNLFVSPAFSSSTGLYSTTATSWSTMTMPSSGGYYGITFGSNNFVAVGNTSTASAYSTNGTTWTAITLPSSVSWYSVTYGNGYFVTVANGSSTGAYSVLPAQLPVNFGIYAGPTTIN